MGTPRVPQEGLKLQEESKHSASKVSDPYESIQNDYKTFMKKDMMSATSNGDGIFSQHNSIIENSSKSSDCKS